MNLATLIFVLKMKLTLVLVPFGKLPYEGVIGDVKKLIPSFIDVEVLESATLPIPESGYNERRGQYRAEVFTDVLASYKKEEHFIYVGIADVDMYVEGLNFVFGLADPLKGVAVVSTYRLNPVRYGEPPNRSLFVQRVLKEILHETGHILGLSHCDDPHCVMHFSNTLMDTDIKGPSFCKRCRKKIKDVVEPKL